MGPTQEDEQHTHSNLQHERDGDENHKGHEEGKVMALFHHGLQLRRVGHEQGNVQHTLRRTLLVGIMVYIDRPVPPTPAGWLWGTRWSVRWGELGDLGRATERGQEGVLGLPGLQGVAKAPASRASDAPTRQVPVTLRKFPGVKFWSEGNQNTILSSHPGLQLRRDHGPHYPVQQANPGPPLPQS